VEDPLKGDEHACRPVLRAGASTSCTVPAMQQGANRNCDKMEQSQVVQEFRKEVIR